MWMVFYNEFAAALALIVLTLGVLFRGDSRVGLPIMLVGVLALVPLAQWSAGKMLFAGDAYMASIYIGAFALAITVGLNYGRGDREAFSRFLAITLLAGALISLAIGFLQWIGIEGGIWMMPYDSFSSATGARPFANLGQPNQFANLLAFGIVSLIYLWQTGSIERRVALIVGVALIFGLVMAASKATWLVICGCVVLWWVARRNGVTRLPAKVLVTGVVLYVGLTLSWSWINEALGYIAIPLGVRQQSAGSRLFMWQQLLDASSLRPLAGWGWNEVSVAQYQVVPNYLTHVTEFTEHSHNLFIDLIIWNGWPIGAFLGLLVIAWCGIRLFKMRDGGDWFALAIVAVGLCHALVEFPLDYMFFLVPLGLAIGLAESRSVAYLVAVPRWVVGSLTCLAVVLTGWIWHDYRVIEEDFRLVRFELSNIKTQPRAEREPSKLLTHLESAIQVLSWPLNDVKSLDQLDLFAKVAQRYPNFGILYRHAIVLGLNGRESEAELEMLRLKLYAGPKTYARYHEALAAYAAERPELRGLLERAPR